MGIYLYGEVMANRIEPEAWTSFYIKSLKIIAAGKLSERDWINIQGTKCIGLIPSRDRQGRWCVSGDLITGDNMESFVLDQAINIYLDTDSDDNGQDVIYALAHNDEFRALRPPMVWFFNAKTQGQRAHMYLLSVLCLAAHHFPEAVAIHGDITAGQCMRAQRMLKNILGEDITLPIQYDAAALYNRVERLYPQDETKRFELFFDVYDGLREEEFQAFLPEHFSMDVIYAHFLKQNRINPKIPTLVRQWLELGLPLERLCSMIKELGKTSIDLIAALACGKVHIKQKITYDGAFIHPGMDRPDDIRMQLARTLMMLRGLRNPNIDAYIPEADILQTLQEVFPEDPIADIWAKALALEAEEPDEKDSARAFYNQLQERVDNTPSQKYDIVAEDDLYFWEPGDTISPELETTQLDNLRAVLAQKDTLWESLKDMDKTQRFQQYIIAMKPYKCFPEPVLQDMCDHVMDDYQGKYDWALVNTDVRYTNINEFVNLMGMNRALFQYLCRKLEGEKNETNS